jgi:hypothetical protein
MALSKASENFAGFVEIIEKFFNGDSCFSGLGCESAKESYQWPLPQNASGKFGDIIGSTRYEQTRFLKLRLHEIWKSRPDQHHELARWIVSDWGGVRGNSAKRIEDYVKEIDSGKHATPLKGVASYSKILSIVDPEQHAVFDARVVVSLVAIQVLGNLVNGVSFPYIPGRNNVIGNVGKRIGFAYQEEFSQAQLSKNGWHKVPRDDAYEVYSNLLLSLKSESRDLMSMEMTLFSQAEKLAVMACPALAN